MVPVETRVMIAVEKMKPSEISSEKEKLLFKLVEENGECLKIREKENSLYCWCSMQTYLSLPEMT